MTVGELIDRLAIKSKGNFDLNVCVETQDNLANEIECVWLDEEMNNKCMIISIKENTL